MVLLLASGGGLLLARARTSRRGSFLLLPRQRAAYINRRVFCPYSKTAPCCHHPRFFNQADSPSFPPPRTLKIAGPKINFCPACGGATDHCIPPGEEKPRAVCTQCHRVHYENPKMVVGCLVVHDGKVLLCKRSIEPSYGLWTLPAGYLELGESAVEGAVRETLEEANADVIVEAPFVQLDIPQIGQSYIIFRARLKTPYFSPGSESLDCALFKLEGIPFEQIAFSSIRVALQLYREDIQGGIIRVHHGVIEKRLGASPSDVSGFILRDHICT